MGMLDYVVHRTPETRERVRQAILRGEVPRWILKTRRARYVAQVIISTPPWADRDALKLVQLRCRQITELSGVDHHVCHIVPLNNPRVCGLTVPWNLEVKTARINLAESNNLPLEGQMALF